MMTEIPKCHIQMQTNMQRKFLSMKKVNIYISHYFIERATADPSYLSKSQKILQYNFKRNYGKTR